MDSATSMSTPRTKGSSFRSRKGPRRGVDGAADVIDVPGLPKVYSPTEVVGMQDKVVAGCSLLSESPRLVRLDMSNVVVEDATLFHMAMEKWEERENVVDLMLPMNYKGTGLGINCFTSLRRLHITQASQQGLSPRKLVRTSDVLVFLQQLTDIRKLRKLLFVSMSDPMNSVARQLSKFICANAKSLQVGTTTSPLCVVLTVLAQKPTTCVGGGLTVLTCALTV